MAPLPIKFQELLQLSSVGVDQNSIGFNTCTLESDSFICVREQKADGSPDVIIIELKNGNNVIRRPIRADSAIMHWSKQVIALRAQSRTLQIFDLEGKKKLKSATMNEDVVFWKWVSDSTLGLVTETAVFHWDVYDANQASPVEVFKRNANLSGCQIINYRINSDGKWMAVVGISQQQGRVVGSMQLYSKDRGISQAIEGHAATFGTLRLEGQPADTKVFTFAVRTATGAKLHIVEIDHPEANAPFQKKAVDIFFPPEANNDFPVAMQVSQKYGVIYMVTKFGFIHLYDLETGSTIFMNRISSDTIFTTCGDTDSAGIVGINRKGQVLYVSVDEANMIDYLLQNPANTDIAVKMASRAGLPGADQLYAGQFQQLFTSGEYEAAAKVAANSPRGFLRTIDTINKFKSLPQQPGKMSYILQYFGMLLDKTTPLNKTETLELAAPVLAQERKHLLEKWLKEGKLDFCEELGDQIRPHDTNLALAVYLKANTHHKVVPALAELGQYDQILEYVQKTGYQPEWTNILQHIVSTNPDRGSEFASRLVNNESGPLIDITLVVNIFQAKGLVQQTTSFLLDVIKDNRPEHAQLQTRLLEMNLQSAPQVADAILGNNMFTQFDKQRIATMCEQYGLFQRAVELYEDPASVKRVLVQLPGMPNFNAEWLVNHFGQMSVEQSLECLDAMMAANIRQNLQVVVNVATKYSELLGPVQLIDLFEKYKTAEGLFYYLGSIVNMSEEEDVHFKYIEAATKIGQFSEVERICRDSNHYNPEKVKNFLKEAHLAEMLPLIIVCDRHNFTHDLILYLYQNQRFNAIETYVQRVNPGRTPEVIAGLLDVDCDDDVIKKLLSTVDSSQIPIDALVDNVGKRNRLKLLLPFLEATLAAGNEQQAVYNALAMIYIDSNNNPEQFLKENDRYDTLSVGKYCEKRDPNLAFIAYQKGQNDLELINITNENSMYRAQARYLLERADRELWGFVLSENNIHRRSVVDQVIATAVPECNDPAKVSEAVASLLAADLPAELIELLKKILLEPSPFQDNSSLQNLLILTAAKSDKAQVSDLIDKLQEFNPDECAELCIDVGLYEEALQIYKKVGNTIAAIEVLTDRIVDMKRIADFAEEVDEPEVWSKVAKAQLDGLQIPESIESYIKANDPKNYLEVIEVATHAGKDRELIQFLYMARKKLREPPIDTALAFSLARLGEIEELRVFLSQTNVANVEESGDKAASEGLYEAAKIFYQSISKWAKLATTLVHLEDYAAAVDTARKANNIDVWSEVHRVCLSKKEFDLAKICGRELVLNAEQLQIVIKRYEYEGYFDELLDVIDGSLKADRAHMGVFTEMGIALSKYHPERVMSHIKSFWSRLNMPKMISACEEANLWPELAFCYVHYDEFDNAALCLMEHAHHSWTNEYADEHENFKDIVVKVANLEIFYRAINFYLEMQPMRIPDLLQALKPRIDVNRVVRMFQKSDNLPLIRDFLTDVQSQNKRTVNDAINDLLIEEENYKLLKTSVKSYDNYDANELAGRLEKHELILFRQVAAEIYRTNRRWDKSIALSKQDKIYEDAIETAALSGKSEIVEDLLRYFVDIGSRECYVGMLYACYDLIRPDVVLELSWRHGLHDFTMPYMINMLCQQTKKIATLESDNEARKAKETAQVKQDDEAPILGTNRLMITAGPAGGAPAQGSFGQPNGFAPQPTGFAPQPTGFGF